MIKAIDLFCGGGGSSFGAQQAGVNIIGGFDIWEPAIKTYKENFPQATTFDYNLSKLNSNDIELIKKQLGNIELILASPECTNHSRAKSSRCKSEESQNTAFDVIKFADVFKPNWIVIENVTEMRNWNKYQELLRSLWELGYFVREIILNAKDFGVPQSRERLFLLCSLSGNSNEIDFSMKKATSASSIIDFSDKYKYSLLFTKKRAKNTILSAERAIQQLGKYEPFLLVYYGAGRKGNGGWQTIDKPLGTITTLDRFGLVIPSKKDGHLIRMLQPDELKLAMGFDNSFKLNEIQGLNRRDKIKLMGNGVSPPVMKTIIQSLCT